MIRSPEMTLLRKATLAVWPLGWAIADVLCTNDIGRTAATRLMIAVCELPPTLAVTVAL